MQVLLISDHEATGGPVRQVLLKGGLDCPADRVVTPETAAARLAKAPADLVVAVLGPDPDRLLAATAELSVRPPTRLVVVGPATDPKLVLRALRGGADDFIDEAELEAELSAALARCRAARSEPEATGRLIAVLAPSGGSGSSTLAANIATVLAKEHHKAALLDLKLEAGDLAALLDLKPDFTLADLCQNVERLDGSLLERALSRHASGVHLLAPPRQLADVPFVTAEGVRRALALARVAFPYVVADLDHSFRDEQMQVLRQADVVLLVLRLDFASLRNARRALEHLERSGVPPDRFRLVVNRYGQPKEVPAAKAEEALGIKIFHYVPDEPRTVNRANNNGVPVVLEAPSAKVSRSVARLAAGVNGRHKAH
jgi:pilus assembly protein CpaE